MRNPQSRRRGGNNKRAGSRSASVLFALLCASACDERDGPASVQQSEPAASERSAVGAASTSAAIAVDDVSRPKVETVLVLDRSAYGVKLIASASGWILVTDEGLYRKQGETPPVHRSTPLNPPFAVMGQQIVHWGDGQLLATSLSGAPPRPLAALKQMPRDVFASNEHFAWLERSASGDRILVADRAANSGNGRAAKRTVHRAEHHIVTGTMLQDWVFFVESLPDGEWRLGAVSIRTRDKSAETASLGPARRGRPPAFLLAENELYYYDGPSRSVKRVTPDLQEETTVAKGVICSPMAVAQELYCAHVGGVFSLSMQSDEADSSPRRVLDGHPQGPITAIAASSRQVVWVEDLDGKQLRVRAIRLP